MYRITAAPLTPIEKLVTSVENRTRFSLDKCEFNIFETHEQAAEVHLQFEGFAITSMLRGKKVLHCGEQALDFIPGQTFMVKEQDEMIIDFPDAQWNAPTQCTALVLDKQYLENQLAFLNEKCPRDKELNQEWAIDWDRLFFDNDENIAGLSHKLIKLFKSDDPLKDVLVDLKLKELMISILRLQNRQTLWSQQSHSINTKQHPGIERMLAVIEYIKRNASQELNMGELSKMAYMSKSSFYRLFTHEFGITPNQMVLQEKMRMAKLLIQEGNMAMKEVCYAVGFSDPNYFSRIFKKMNGLTPGEFKSQIHFNA